jgi:hypothetical protein
MFPYLPLDDQLNRLFYVNGALCRLVYANVLGRCVLRQEVPHIAFDYAVTLIAAGELLWSPPAYFERLDGDTWPEAVQRERDLLGAFLRSPAGRSLSHVETRTRLESRLGDNAAWLVRRALNGGAADAPAGDG